MASPRTHEQTPNNSGCGPHFRSSLSAGASPRERVGPSFALVTTSATCKGFYTAPGFERKGSGAAKRHVPSDARSEECRQALRHGDRATCISARRRRSCRADSPPLSRRRSSRGDKCPTVASEAVPAKGLKSGLHKGRLWPAGGGELTLASGG